jgi:hypothetical protein
MLTLLKIALAITAVASFGLAAGIKLNHLKRGHPLDLWKWRGIEFPIAIGAILVGIGSVLGLRTMG